MAKKDISISAALKRMKKLFPGQYVTVQYQAHAFEPGNERLVKRVYAQFGNWSDDCITFEEAIQNLLLKGAQGANKI